ncbi:hypothetical protein A3750_11525 [Oleiphilus sp. HI0079]|uniref:exosortase n=1 Tax=Oleiphilus sp. HI0079 TaxID=1822254 RepID=UPI0007C3A9F5|nr:exosortase [Oleiphilus sp. HI0079]KZZ15491.1 hypothetical protein A3750_11525 [Oleiphilus sp. HI0079]
MRSQYSPLVSITLFFLFQAILFHEAWGSLVQLWLKMDYAYSMGLLALALAIYSAFQKRDSIATSAHKPHAINLILLFGSALVLTLASYLNIQIGTQLMLVPILFFGISSISGVKAAAHFIIPLLYILFAIPVWDYLNPLLQELTTLVSTNIVEALEMPALINGNTINLPYGTLEIAGGCSGLRYFIVTLILVLYFSQQRPNSTRTVISMFFIAAGFSLIANWIRVVLLIVIAHQSNMESSLVADHEMFGWVVYVVTMMPCVWLLLRIERRALVQTEAKVEAEEQNTLPIEKAAHTNQTIRPGYLVTSIVAISIAPLLMGLAQYNQTQSYSKASFETQLAAPPSSWAITEAQTSIFQTGFTGAENENNFQLINTFSGTKLNVKILRYGSEHQGAELVNNNNRLASDSWKTSYTSANNFYQKATLTNQLHQKLAVIWYYRISNTRTTNELKAKLAQLTSVFADAPPKALVAISARCSASCDKEFSELDKLLSTYEPY